MSLRKCPEPTFIRNRALRAADEKGSPHLRLIPWPAMYRCPKTSTASPLQKVTRRLSAFPVPSSLRPLASSLRRSRSDGRRGSAFANRTRFGEVSGLRKTTSQLFSNAINPMRVVYYVAVVCVRMCVSSPRFRVEVIFIYYAPLSLAYNYSAHNSHPQTDYLLEIPSRPQNSRRSKMTNKKASN